MPERLLYPEEEEAWQRQIRRQMVRAIHAERLGAAPSDGFPEESKVITDSAGYSKLLLEIPSVRDPDWEAFAGLLRRAKGRDRLAKEYADQIGVDPTILSKLCGAKYRGRVADAALVKAAMFAAPSSGVTLAALLEALGRRVPRDPAAASEPPDPEGLAKAVMFSLAERGALVGLDYCRPDRDFPAAPVQFGLTVLGPESESRARWHFKYSPSERAAEDDMRRIISMYVTGEVARGEKASVVVDRPECLEAVKRAFENARCRDEVSAVLVDEGRQRAVDEFRLPMEEGMAPSMALLEARPAADGNQKTTRFNEGGTEHVNGN